MEEFSARQVAFALAPVNPRRLPACERVMNQSPGRHHLANCDHSKKVGRATSIRVSTCAMQKSMNLQSNLKRKQLQKIPFGQGHRFSESKAHDARKDLGIIETEHLT